MDDFVQDTADMERNLKRHSRLLPAGIALILIAAFGAVVWFAFLEPSVAPDEGQTVELIQADPEPIKSKPEDPGGMEVQHQDKLILNPDPEKPQVERLLPPPEDPLPVPQQQVETEAAEPAQDGEPEEGLSENTDGAGTNAASSLLKKPETETEASRTKTTKDATQNTAAPEEQGASGAEAGDAEVAEEPAASTNESAPKTVPETQRAAADEETAPATANEPAQKVSKPEAASTEAASAAALRQQVAQVPTDSGYVLQLASLRSEALALQEWSRIQNGNKNLLAQMKPILEKADIEGIGVRYRLQTGPFPTKATAQDLCSQLKAAKQDCLVKRRN